MATNRAGRGRFRYAADPVCLLAVAAHWANRWWVKPTAWGRVGFFHDYLNDVLLVPAFLPPTLWLHRRLGLRSHDRRPTAGEVAGHVLLWSACFLLLFPRWPWLYRHSTADPWNAAAFAAGGAVAWAVWRRAASGILSRMEQLAPLPRRYTAAEYFRIDDASEERLDFRDGEIVAMSGGSINHSRIIHNTGGELRSRLKGSPCEGFDPGVKVRLARLTLYAHPDVMVVCGPVELDSDDETGQTILNPTLIVEVLSPSTQLYDRSEKFERYRAIPSFRQYVLVSQVEPLVETFHLSETGIWAVGPTIRGLDGVVPLTAVGVELPMAEAYAHVAFPPRPVVDRPAV